MLTIWLQDMLGRRGLQRPDGRWLYGYRLTTTDYHELRKELQTVIKVSPPQQLARSNHQFAALFVLYAAEWWRREYDGGAWKWAPILASLGIQKADFSPNERTGLVLSGFAFWGLRPTTGEGKRYFGSVVAHGGLPLKLIGHGGSRLSSIMAVVLKQASRYGWMDDQVAGAISDHSHSMPESLRHEEVYSLLSKVVLSTLKIKDRHQLGGLADPLAHLDTVEPGWRDEYPLQIDDAAAVQLLTSLVKAASQESFTHDNSAVFRVVRTLSPSGPGEWQIESQITHPAIVNGDSLAHLFGMTDGSVLPRYFDIDADIEARYPLTSCRLLLGSTDVTVSVMPQRKRWSGLSACDEHILYLRTAGRDMTSGGISLPGGDSLIDDQSPWVFVEELDSYRLAGIGDVRLPDASAIIAVPDDAVPMSLDGDSTGIERVGTLSLDSMQGLALWKILGNVQVSIADDSWKIRLSQTSKLTGSLVLEGRRVSYPSRPWPVFRGKPHIVRYDDDGGRSVIRNGLQWFAAGTKTSIDPTHYCGPVELHVTEDGERIGLFRLVLIMEHSKEFFKDSAIELSGWGFSDIAVEQSEGVHGQATATDSGCLLSLQPGSIPPRDFLTYLRWQNSGAELKLRMPLPVSGGRAFSPDGNPVVSGTAMSLRNGSGIRVLVFDQNPQYPKTYEIELELMGDPVLSRSGSSVSRHPVHIGNGMGEVRLLDYYNEIEALLGMSGELDAYVRLTLIAGGKKDFNINVSRYDVVLIPTGRGVSLTDSDLRMFSVEQIRGCELLALPLLEPEKVPRELADFTSEGVPCGSWSVDGLDSGHEPWLIYPGEKSVLDFRPLIYTASVRHEHQLAVDIPSCQLAVALRIEDPSLRSRHIDNVLINMAGDFGHDSWSMLDNIWSAFGRLPLCSIDTFKVLATRPEVVVAMLVRSELPPPQLIEHVRQLKQQLGLALELVGIDLWRQTIGRFSDYWCSKFGEEVSRISLPIVLKGRLQTIAAHFPGLQLTMEWLAFEWLNECGDLLCRVQREAISDKTIHLKQLWQGGDSLLQRLLLRVHAEGSWPEPRYFTDKAVPAFKDALTADSGRNKLLQKLQNFFWLSNGDFKLSVANMPVLCALWSALSLDLDWWSEPAHRLALQRIRAFDPQWFEEAYGLAFAACLATEVVRPVVVAQKESSPLLRDSPRVFRR